MLLEHWYEEIMERDWRRTLEAAERLKNCGPDETVRIWADGLPDSACGLLHAASLLAGTRAQISVVLLPPWKVRLDGIVEIYQGWGEVSPEEFGAFLPLEQPLTPIVLRMLSDRWHHLQEENAPPGRWSTAVSEAWMRTSMTIAFAAPCLWDGRRSQD